MYVHVFAGRTVISTGKGHTISSFLYHVYCLESHFEASCIVCIMLYVTDDVIVFLDCPKVA